MFYLIVFSNSLQLIEFDDPKNTLNASGVSEPIVYSMMNFRWNREIIETTDERIAIRFIGTNYTSVHNVTGLTGTINLTVNINTFNIIFYFPKFY